MYVKTKKLVEINNQKRIFGFIVKRKRKLLFFHIYGSVVIHGFACPFAYQNSKTPLLKLSTLFYCLVVKSESLHHVGPRNQSHGVDPRSDRRFDVHGYGATCSFCSRLLGVRHSPVVAVLHIRCCECCQCRRLLAPRRHTVH